ncbi:MAG: esterase family protein [Sandaracinaceae bacterium]
MSLFERSRWYSRRVQREVTLCRWGHHGMPVLVLPTAGGDAEEVERWQMIRALSPLLAAGRIKVYSCDSVAGQAWFAEEGTLGHRMWLMSQFQEYIRHEVAPAIHMDCRTEGIPIWTAGASVGALHAVALVCRYPDVFHRALGMSGTYDLLRFTGGDRYTHDYYAATPLRFVPNLRDDDPHLIRLRQRYVLLASGEGRAEAIDESWNMASVLGAQRIPNWVDSWGPHWHHDWPTWRAMLPKYLGEWTET